MKKKDNNIKEEFKENLNWFLRGYLKIGLALMGSKKNIVMFLIQFGIFIISILLVIELFKINNLNYEKIYMYLLFIISGKLSWLIQNTD